MNNVNVTTVSSDLTTISKGDVRSAIAVVREHEATLVDPRGRPVEFFVRVQRKDGSTYTVPARLTLAVAMQIAGGGRPEEDGLDKAILKATPGGRQAVEALKSHRPDLRLVRRHRSSK